MHYCFHSAGDPNCVWTKGARPGRSINITHPGICEPVDSAKCNAQKDWVSCSGKKFSCHAINETGVKIKDVRPPLTKVSAITFFVFLM